MFKAITAGAAIALCALGPAAGNAIAAEQPNLLIMGEDADRDTVPRNSRVFNRVLRAIESEMQAEGFSVYDETAVSMSITDPGRVRRTDAELITVARRVQDVPIDAVTVFQIYVSSEENAFADIMDLRARIPGRLLNVHTGEALANYEISYGPGELPPLPPSCNRDCVLEHVGEQARRIAADVGAVLATHLDNLAPAGARAASATLPSKGGGSPDTSRCEGLTTAYTLTFRSFGTDEISTIEEYLVSFGGYEHHRPMRVGGTESTYWYETCSDAARLNRNIRLMAEHMGVDARIGMVNNSVEVDKIRAPRER